MPHSFRRGLWMSCWLVFAASGANLELPPLASDVLAAHNAYRTKLGLRPLVWSDKLASAAQSWADKLLKRREFRHEPQSTQGENLLEVNGGGSATPDDVVHDWASESLDYDYASNRCYSKCGHYTQLVWRSTAEVGCAMARDRHREVWVCRYYPPGNVVGRRPY